MSVISNWLILKIISQCDSKHIIVLLIKTIMWVLKVSTYIIPSIAACPIGLATVLMIMSVSTFKTAFTLYIFYFKITSFVVYLIFLCFWFSYFWSDFIVERKKIKYKCKMSIYRHKVQYTTVYMYVVETRVKHLLGFFF